MRTITIGRGDGSDILIDDYRISRRHAILKVYTFGKMEIVDMGQNGTWVNGVKLRPGVPFPVKRSDVINFAEASQLDWSQVKNPMKYAKIIGAVVAILVLLGILIFWISSTLSDAPTQIEDNSETVVKPSDGSSVRDSFSAINPSNVKKPTKEAETQKKKETTTPKTVQELFPQKIKSKDKDKKEEKREKKNEKTGKPQDTKKPEESSSVNVIL